MSPGVARLRQWMFVTVVAAGLAAAGCGGGSKTDTGKQDTVPNKPIQALPQPKQGSSGFVPALSPTGKPASPAAIAVIRGWADALLGATFTRPAAFSHFRAR